MWMSLFGYESLSAAPWVQILLDLKTCELQKQAVYTYTLSTHDGEKGTVLP